MGEGQRMKHGSTWELLQIGTALEPQGIYWDHKGIRNPYYVLIYRGTIPRKYAGSGVTGLGFWRLGRGVQYRCTHMITFLERLPKLGPWYLETSIMGFRDQSYKGRGYHTSA